MPFPYHASMTEVEVIKVMRAHLEAQFPKVCGRCNYRFATLREYMLITKPRGSAIPYDADVGDWHPLHPWGVYTFAGCPCGNIHSLSSQGLPISELWALLNWAQFETYRRQMTPRELLNYLRDEISKQVLAAPEHDAT